jgi:protein TonB
MSSNATHQSYGHFRLLASRSYRPAIAQDQTPLRRRVSGFALAIGINLLLLLVLLTLGVLPRPGKRDVSPLVVEFEHESSGRPHPATVKKQNPKQVTQPRLVLPSKPTITPKSREKSTPWVEMSKDELASADIRNLAKSNDSEEVGRTPNGDVLYAAEWARHPTNAQLGGYLPHDAPDGYGLVACKTMPDDRVDDCVELEDYPLGSHLARAVRQAAWQFKVRPPRKNGHPLIGSWVRIRIEYYGRGSSVDG